MNSWHVMQVVHHVIQVQCHVMQVVHHVIQVGSRVHSGGLMNSWHDVK